MKKYIAFIVFFGLFYSAFAQSDGKQIDGKVSYITSKNVYVRFDNTEGLQANDTLYTTENGKPVAALLINTLSSISAVCTPLIEREFKSGEAINGRILTKAGEEEKLPAEAVVVANEAVEDNSLKPLADPFVKQKSTELYGRLAVSSYTHFSNTPANNTQRMRYILSLNAPQIQDSKVSFESYLAFTHKNDNWDKIQENVFNGLKIYNLNVAYSINENTNIILGRKINRKLANIGAIDGLQFEQKINDFSIGLVAGFRPDTKDYSFNSGLFQGGAYLNHLFKKEQVNMEHTLAFMEQRNGGQTDRRLLYLQHSSSIGSKVFLFFSGEMDLYKKVDEVKQNTFDLTNIYFSVRYRPIRKLSLSLSYDRRKNIIYYETYKSFIDQLLENEALQGYRFSFNWRAVQKLSIGGRVGYRDRKGDYKASRNANIYINYSRIPFINTAASVSFTRLETSYLDGNIYGLRLSKDLIRAKLFSSFSYRRIQYQYTLYESDLTQNSFEFSLNWRIINKLSLSANYEAITEKARTYNRFYINLTQRF